ncbi:MAG: FAD-dependent oxidoreductase [Pseudomonadales bacterium]|nr:FAD-dependent oxidoreductase [Pseudomonadales bacterium]
MNVAVVGGGISGIAAAYFLSKRVDVTLYEADMRLGGHTDTHSVRLSGRTFAVDSGFIVFNRVNYPRFSAWLDTLGVATQPSDMSFSVSCRDSGLEYGTSDLSSLFSDRRNLLSAAHYRMLTDIGRFYRAGPAMVGDETEQTLGEYLKAGRYSERFIRHHIVPMCGALWSQPAQVALEMPLSHVVSFMDHHRMFHLRRHAWQVVCGGSSSYIDAFCTRFPGQILLGEPVQRIVRTGDGVTVKSERRQLHYDAVFLACHSDQALALLADGSPEEREVLGAFSYRRNRTVLHTDPSYMPRDRRTWSSWNAMVGVGKGQASVTYWMNRLQSLDGPNLFVSLNPADDPEGVVAEREYAHPVFNVAARKMQQRRDQIDGVNKTYFCGAYWGWGFHEDGFSSALRSADRFASGHQRAA